MARSARPDHRGALRSTTTMRWRCAGDRDQRAVLERRAADAALGKVHFGGRNPPPIRRHTAASAVAYRGPPAGCRAPAMPGETAAFLAYHERMVRMRGFLVLITVAGCGSVPATPADGSVGDPDGSPGGTDGGAQCGHRGLACCAGAC